MEVKGFNNAAIAKSAYSNQTVQKNQVAFQGSNLITKAKEVAFKVGMEGSPLFMIPEPIHYVGTYFTKYICAPIANIAKIIKEARKSL